MTTSSEASYYKKMDENSKQHAIGKPFSDANAAMLVAQLAAALEQMPRGHKKMIDMGCGTGWTSRFFASAGYDVLGFELAPEAVKEAQKLTPPELKDRLHYEVGDFEDVPYNNTFDIALFVDALHHSEDEVAVLRQVHKALKKGGVCVVVEPGVGHATTEKSLAAIRDFGVTERDMPPRIVKKAAQKIGFSEVQTYPHPAGLFAAAYRPPHKVTGKKRLVLRFTLLRALVLLYRVTLGKTRHGMVVLVK